MVESRSLRTSTRIKTESTSKRKFSDTLEDASTPSKPAKNPRTSAKVSTKVATPKRPTSPTPPIEEPLKPVLPTKLTDSTPLPVLPEPQSSDLKDSEWQSMTDSGVFAASLARARQAISRGTYLEKFWTKPTAMKKQKDMTEEEKTHFKAAKGPTQSKVGSIRLISEPLTFDVQVFMIRDQSSSQKLGQLPMDKQHLIYGTSPHRTITPQNAPYRPPFQPPQPHHVAPTPPPPQPPGPIIPNPSVSRTPPPPLAVKSAPKAPPPPAPKPPAPKAATQAPDPVIHALAQRASANPELKAIMKIVATGRASQQQLTYFQRHIDELTEMVKQRQEQEARARGPTVPLATPKPAQAQPTPTQSSQAVAQQRTQVPAHTQPQQQRNQTQAQPKPQAPQQQRIQTQPQAMPQAQSQTQSQAQSQTQSQQHRNQTQLQNLPKAQTQPQNAIQHVQTQSQIQQPRPQPLVQPQQLQPPTQQSHQQVYQSQQTVPQAMVPSKRPNPTPQPPKSTPRFYQPPVPVPPRPKMVTTAPPLHVILEFSENKNERFLFPKHSILEFQDNLTTIICSFIVLKKKIDKELWTPISITIKGDAPTLSVIGRVVEPVDVVRKYMEDIMVKHERADDEYLAFRLPRDGAVIEES